LKAAINEDPCWKFTETRRIRRPFAAWSPRRLRPDLNSRRSGARRPPQASAPLSACPLVFSRFGDFLADSNKEYEYMIGNDGHCCIKASPKAAETLELPTPTTDETIYISLERILSRN